MTRRPDAGDRQRLDRLNRAVARANDPDEPWAARCHAARWAASLAERCGLWRRPARCEGCGERTTLDRHHESHEKPLVVVYLCRACHAHADGRGRAAG